MRHVPILLLSLATAAPASAQQASDLATLDAQLPGTLINDPTRLDWPLAGEAERRTIRSAAIPGGGAVRIGVRRVPANAYDVQLKAPITGAIRRGDDVVVAIWMRTAATEAPDGQGKVALRVQQDSASYPGFADTVVAVGSEWRSHEVSGKADRDYPAGAAVVSIQLGAAAQTIEVGQAIVVKGATSLGGAQAPAAGAAPAPSPIALPRQLQGLGATINDPADRDWTVYGNGITHQAAAAAITGRVATRVVVAAKQANRWDAGVNAPIAGAIKQGQPLRVAFIARTVASDAADGRGTVTIRVQSNRPPYDGFGDNDVAVGTDWQLIQLKTVADRALPAGQGVVALHLGGAAQTLELGPIWVIETAP